MFARGSGLSGKRQFPAQAHGCPAGDEQRDAGTHLEQIRQIRRGGDDLLQVVEHLECLAICECRDQHARDRTIARFADPKIVGDDGKDKAGIAHCGEFDEDRAVSEAVRHCFRDAKR